MSLPLLKQEPERQSVLSRQPGIVRFGETYFYGFPLQNQVFAWRNPPREYDVFREDSEDYSDAAVQYFMDVCLKYFT
jgi:hypothetical protein